MTDEPFLAVVRALNSAGLDYMLTGSYASNIYGVVRSTFDADIVLRLVPGGMARLTGALAGFYLDARTEAEVREVGGVFNAIHRDSGLKVDFYLPGSDEFGRSSFARRRRQELWGETVWVISPEDLVLAKLLWAKQGGSGRQLEDARGICRVQGAELDRPYLKDWAARLSVRESFEALLPE